MLWGISWLNVQLMIADAPRSKDLPTGEDEEFEDFDDTAPTISTKEDIKNLLTQGLL